MRLAVLILCHNNPQKINRLISALDDSEIDIFVHVDKKSKIDKDIIVDSNRIKLLPMKERIDVKWAKFSQIEAELNLIRYAVKTGVYDYYLLLSGSDYPLVSMNSLKSYLADNKGYNFLNLYKSQNYNNNGKANHYDKCNDIVYSDWLLTRYGFPRIVRRIWVAITGGYNHTFSIFKRKFDDSTKFYYGSQWWCLSDGFVKWFLEYLNKNTQYVDFFRKSSTPDESFFHTLLMNSTYAKTRVDYLHYIDWATNANSPKDLALDDFNNIVNSKKLFARKINDDALMTQIDKYITN